MVRCAWRTPRVRLSLPFNLYLVYITQPTGEGPRGVTWGLPSPSKFICKAERTEIRIKKSSPKVKKPNQSTNGLDRKAWCEGVSIETRLLGLPECTSTIKKKKKIQTSTMSLSSLNVDVLLHLIGFENPVDRFNLVLSGLLKGFENVN